MPCPAADRASFFTIPQGEVAEWLKAHAWKACLGETLTWVRIPLSPPHLHYSSFPLTDRRYQLLVLTPCFQPCRDRSRLLGLVLAVLPASSSGQRDTPTRQWYSLLPV